MTSNAEPNPSAPRPDPRRPVPGAALKLAALAAVAAVAVAGACRLQQDKPAAPADDEVPQPAFKVELPPGLFRGWESPDLVLVLTGQQNGYLLPCGCSRPQKGGLERRYNFVQALRAKGWSVVLADLGDVPQRHGPVALPNVQGLVKYRYAMQAMKTMGYAAVGIGEHEAALPLSTALDEWALNNPEPAVVAANLDDHENKFPGEIKDWVTAAPAPGTPLPSVKVGVAGAVGPLVAKAITAKDPGVKFASNGKRVLPEVLKQMDAAGVELRVLLYQGSLVQTAEKGSKAEAVELAKAFPQFQVVVAQSEEEEPSSYPVVLTKGAQGAATSLAVGLGHKGKYVGAVGVWKPEKAGDPFTLRYQLVEMGEEFLTPAGAEDAHPVAKLIEAYTKELKDGNYLAKYGQAKHPHQVAVKGVSPTYRGSEACKGCHRPAYDVWKKSDHGHAYKTLVDVKHPSNRQYDAECVVCHTVGFGNETGFADEVRTPKLVNVGCENCHGPGSAHIDAEHGNNDADKATWRKLMNEWKAPAGEDAAAKTRRLDRIETFCKRCHDIDNDVHWVRDGKNDPFAQKWGKIVHMTPPGE
jgi:hypothetical protein